MYYIVSGQIPLFGCMHFFNDLSVNGIIITYVKKSQVIFHIMNYNTSPSHHLHIYLFCTAPSLVHHISHHHYPLVEVGSQHAVAEVADEEPIAIV